MQILYEQIRNKTKELNIRKSRFLVILILIVISISLFSIGIAFNFPDIKDHNKNALDIFTGKMPFPGYFLYFSLLMLPLFLSAKMLYLQVFSVTILTLSVLYKYYVTERIFLNEIKNNDFEPKPELTKFLAITAILFSFLLLLSQNLIYKFSATMFIGYLPINTWHNSTTIFLMPFSIILFYECYKYLLEANHGRLKIIFLLIVINIITKPSFFMVLAVVFPLYVFSRYKFSKSFYYIALIIFLGGIALFLQAKYTFYTNGLNAPIKIAPFNVWGHWSDNILLSFISSVFFPVTFISLYFKECKSSVLVKFSSSLFICGVMIYIVFSESGYKEFDGNFAWQNIICNYLLFLSCLITLLKEVIGRRKFLTKDYIIFLAFFLHVFIGVIYLLKFPVFSYR